MPGSATCNVETNNAGAELQPQNSRDWLIALSVFLLALAAFFTQLGSFGVLDGSESYYPASVREMLECGDYLIPQLNYQTYFSKPIMTFWLIAAAYHLFGISEFAGRFFSALLSVALVMLCFHVTKGIGNTRAAFLASLILAGSPLYLEYARVSSVDAFLTFFSGCAFLSLLMLLCARRPIWWIPLYSSLAAAVLTKGPAALALFVPGVLLYLLLTRPSKQALGNTVQVLRPLAGLALFSLLALPWFVAAAIATNGLTLKVFLFYENLARLLGHTTYRVYYWWRYPVVLFLGMIPWSILILPVVGSVWNKLKELRKSPQPATSLIDARSFSLCLSLGICALFFLSRTQMEPYILPALAPLAVATALTVEEWISDGDSRGLIWLRILSIFCAVLGPLGALMGIVWAFNAHGVSAWINQAIILASVILAGGWIAQLLLFRSARRWQSMLVAALTSTVMASLAVPAALAYWYETSHKDLHELCRTIERPDVTLALFMAYRPSVMFYAKRPVHCFFQPEQLKPPSVETAPYPPTGRRLWVLSDKAVADKLCWHPDISKRLIAGQGKWALYEIEGAWLKPYDTMEHTFSILSPAELSFGRHPFGTLADYFSGGQRNLPAKFEGNR
ncbi:MAG TPA: glycosyltransferase family 39 protein [Candidatus Obscuribacterales bacterium]